MRQAAAIKRREFRWVPLTQRTPASRKRRTVLKAQVQVDEAETCGRSQTQNGLNEENHVRFLLKCGLPGTLEMRSGQTLQYMCGVGFYWLSKEKHVLKEIFWKTWMYKIACDVVSCVYSLKEILTSISAAVQKKNKFWFDCKEPAV